MDREQFESKHSPDSEVRSLRKTVAELERKLEEQQEEHGSLKVLFRELTETIETLPPPKVEYHTPKAMRSETVIAHVSHWTDWHNGAVQDSDEVEGFNEFNPAILRKRILNCVRDQLDWLELHRKSYRIPVSHDLVTGDLISGGIHQELLVTNEYPEPVQAIKAGELLAEAVAMKVPHYEKVVVDFLVVDNHSRLTKKPQAGEAGFNSWNYVVGFFAKERLRDFPTVEFNIYPVIQTVVEVNQRRYLLTHGHTVMGWAGFPYYGIGRLVGREATKRMGRALKESKAPSPDVRAVIGKMFDKVVMGHWHAPLWTPWYIIGGAAQGTTAYDHSQGRHSDPVQGSWFVHPKWGEFDRTDWLLKDD